MIYKTNIFICWSLMILFILLPGIAHKGAELGLDVFIHRLLPYLLPYLVVSQWLLFVLYKANTWKPNFLNSLKIYGIGAFGGFPTGAATIATLVKANMLSSKTASHLIGICHAPSPMFVVGVVGTQFLSSPQKGLILLIVIHVINALFLVLFHKYIPNDRPVGDSTLNKHIQSPFSEGVHQTASILLLVATTVVFFTTVSTVITAVIDYFTTTIPQYLVVFIYSFFEMTAGLEVAFQMFAQDSLFPILAVSILSFNGVSIHMQVIVLAKSASLSLRPYFIYRLLHFVLISITWIIISK